MYLYVCITLEAALMVISPCKGSEVSLKFTTQPSTKSLANEAKYLRKTSRKLRGLGLV